MTAAPMTLTPTLASKFASLALAHTTREFPNKLDHVLLDAGDARTPRALHPVFYGSFDWHSCVHGYWLLARLLRRMPDLPEADRIRALFDAHLTPPLVAVEAAYAAHASRGGFERPYGWAWLLMLAAELAQHANDDERRWCDALLPLAHVFRDRFIAFLPKATYPVRVGTHFNTAFALMLARAYARTLHDEALATAIDVAAHRWFDADVDAQCWEPGGDDFLSGTLVEAVCMQGAFANRVTFDAWLDRFLPRIALREPRTLFVPATVSDRSDGKIAHLDGLNLSRAWCWRTLAAHWPASDARHAIAHAAAEDHLAVSLPHIAGDYAGEHWLATYALLALDHAD